MQLNKTILASMIASLSLSAVAQSPETADEENLETVVVTGEQDTGFNASRNSTATKLELSLKQTPQSVSVINSEILDTFALDDINDALTLTTGIQVEKPETDRVYYSARGFDITQFQMDGMGMPLSNNNVYGNIDTALFERIEVVRGANGLTAGMGDPSATINFIRKRPTGENQSQVKASVGSWNKARLEGDTSINITDDLQARAVVVKENRDSYLDRYEQDKTIGYGVLQWQPSFGGTLSAGHSVQNVKTDGPLWGALPLVYSDGTPTNYDRSTSSAAEWSYWDNKETRSFVQYEFPFSNGWQITSAVNYVEMDTDSYLFYVAGTPDPVDESGVVAAYASEYDLDEWQTMAEVYASGPFQMFGQVHELVVGQSFSKAKVTQTSIYDATTVAGFSDPSGLTPINIAQFDGQYPLPVFNVPGGGGAREDEELATYATAKWQLAENHLLITGLRVSQWEREGTAYGTVYDSKDDVMIPYIGYVHDLTDQVSAYTSYTETFVPQSEVNADLEQLDPKTGQNIEVGLKAEFDGVNAMIAIFQTEQDNVATFVETVNAVDIYKGENGFESEGIELDVAGAVSDDLNVFAGMSYVKITDQSGERANLFTPEKTVNIAANYAVTPAFNIGGTAKWQSEIEGTVKQDAYTLVSLAAGYDITPDLKANLVVNNLTDEKYLTSLKWSQGYYGAPRNVVASISYDF